jgi:5-deoxy-glucuronate isomerase
MPSSSLRFPCPAPALDAGYVRITSGGLTGEATGRETGLEFGLLRQTAGGVHRAISPLESAWVLLRGAATVEVAGERVEVRRADVFDTPPTTLHLPRDTAAEIRGLANDTEWAVVRTANDRAFAARLFLPSDDLPEYRGAGLVQNAALRCVRLIFDRALRPESNLVVGEVVNYPGRWSSYPPHHHDQPEIYHYRFTAATGYGHAELGDDVLKVRHGDTVVIPPGLDHAQVSAPGYGMYYLWMIRHLPGHPYTGFTCTPDHAWTLDPVQQGWRPAHPPPGLT